MSTFYRFCLVWTELRAVHTVDDKVDGAVDNNKKSCSEVKKWSDLEYVLSVQAPGGDSSGAGRPPPAPSSSWPAGTHKFWHLGIDLEQSFNQIGIWNKMCLFLTLMLQYMFFKKVVQTT